jgi:hypothetical protein
VGSLLIKRAALAAIAAGALWIVILALLTESAHFAFSRF